ncbi:MAG: SHOCT domain-containing protein [Candidatus Promineifilaceae bacterium]
MEEMIAQCMEMMEQMQSMMDSGMMGRGMLSGQMMGSGSPLLASPWYWLGWILVLAVLAGLVVAAILVIRRVAPAPPAETPLQILKRRYARGEIDAAQFEAMKQQLSEDEAHRH